MDEHRVDEEYMRIEVMIILVCVGLLLMNSLTPAPEPVPTV